ncbi:MAG: hypothetical protein COB07_07790 [Sulfurovum sp.]|nr:MAG: hypothetical protein COB07_07790 [Sulfurovum sp.]
MTHHKNILCKLPKITLPVLLLLCFTSSAFPEGEKEKELVLEVYPQWYSNEDYTVQGNIGIDSEFQQNNWTEYYVSPSAAYALDHNWALHGGLGGYYKDYRDSANRWEVRPYVGVSHYTAWTDKWTLSSYFRAEERYYAYNGDENSINNTRLRFRVRAAYTLDQDFVFSSWRKFTVGAEVFKSDNSDHNTTDTDTNHDYETRLVLGLERQLLDQSKLRFELAWQYKSKPGQVSTSSSVNTVYFKLKYYPVWGTPLRNKLLDRGIDE